MVEEWSNPDRVNEYLSGEIPHRDVAEELLLEALPDSVERVLDLGTGDGRMLALIRTGHPNASGVGIDSSAPMLERARRRFLDDESIDLRLGDLANLSEVGGSFDAVVSALAIHHLEHAKKRVLFREIYRLLKLDGVFVNLDLVSSPSEELHEHFRRAINRPQDDPTDRLAGLGEQLEWLEDAGFGMVDCRFKWLELTLFVARRS